MNLLERYLGWNMIKAVLLTLIVLLTLLAVVTFVDEMGDVGRGQFQTKDAFVVAWATAPKYILDIFPVATLLGALLSLGALANQGELTAMRAAGMSLSQLAMALVKAAVVLLVVLFGLAEGVTPIADDYVRNLKLTKQEGKTALRTDQGLWAKDGDALVHFQRILPNGQIQGVQIFELDEQRHLRLVTQADSALLSGDTWQVSGIKQTRLQADSAKARQVAQATWDSLLDPALLQLVALRPDTLPVWGLYRYVQILKSHGQQPIQFEIVLWSKLAAPVMTLVMVVLALVLVLSANRAVSAGQRIFMGAILGAGLFFVNRAMTYLVVVYDLNPVIAILLPISLFVSMAFIFFRQVN